MNQTEAGSIKHLAKLVVEVLPRITERECSKCWGRGHLNRLITTADCNVCSGTGKVKWKWKPKVGEHYYFTFDLKHRHWIMGELTKLTAISYWNKGELIPILHWETLETVLEGVGYWLQIGRPHAGGLAKTQCMINKGDEANSRVCVRGKDRQEAVMRAVIKLGNSLKEITDGRLHT